MALAQTVTSVTRTVSFDYDAFGTMIQQVVEPDDAAYRVTTVFVPEPTYGVITSRAVSWLDPLTGAQSRVDLTGYDARFRYAETLTNAKNQVEHRTYDPATGDTLTATDANQLTKTWQYDPWGRKTRITRPDNTATSWDYRKCVDSCLNGAVSVTIERNWAGSSQTTVPTEHFVDSLSRQVLTRSWGFDGTPVLTQRTYDSLGRVEKASRPHFSNNAAVWTWYDRDAIGRVEQIRSPNRTGTGYDATQYIYNGLVRTATNAKNQLRTELRNGVGKLKSVTDTYGWATSYEYDPFGNLVRTTDPKGNQITIGYDKLGRKTSLSDPNLGAWTYLVDPVGQTRRQWNANSQEATFEFDPLGRMVHRLEQGLESFWSFDTSPNGIGQLGEAYTWAAGTKDYRRVHSYDSFGRLSSTVTSLDWDYSDSTTYDAFGRIDAEHHRRAARGAGATGVSNSFYTRYNAQGYAHQVDRHDGAYATIWQALLRDAEGRTTRRQLGNGVVTDQSFNGYTGRLETIKSGPSSGSPSYQNDSYDYDVLGNLTSRNQLVATAGGLLSETFTYDGLNRLQTSTLGAAVKSTYYDEIGNITSKTGAGVYTYPTRPNAVGSITGTVAGLSNPTFEYDNNGNLLKGLARAYAWTSYNMASSIDRLSGDTAVQRTAFIYGPEHERTRQTVSPMSGGVPGVSAPI